MREKPVYLATGFLESGKTTLLKEMLSDEEFLEGEKVLVVCTEEGTESFDEEFLRQYNADIVYIDSIDDLTPDFFTGAEKKYDFDLVFFELNGMWDIGEIYEKIPRRWPIVQIFTTIDATTFEMYLNNMRALIMNIVKMSDCVIMNRCGEKNDLASYRRTLRGVNPQANIIFEDKDGNINNDIQDILPYDTDSDVITVETDDFGIFILDIQENPERYIEHTVEFTAMVYIDDQMKKGEFFTGRFAMACCAADAQFIGFMCKYENEINIEDRKFYTIRGLLRFEENPMYVQEGPVIYVSDVTEAPEPKDQFVYFN